MWSLWPRQCMATNGTPASRTTAAMSGSARPPLTSLTISAPASSAADAISARMVSMLTTAPAATRPRTTGSTRPDSSSALTRCAPGRVDSPPTSTMSAPSCTSDMPWVMAASGSRNAPPSEKESGVTLTTPMTRQRVQSRQMGRQPAEVRR